MTRDDTDARRVVDALTDLFDAMPPSDRAAAEDELRDAGVDPEHVGRRLQGLAARRLQVDARSREPSAPLRRPGSHGRESGARAAQPPGTARPRRVVGLISSAAALLLVGVAIGWLLARQAGESPQLARLDHGGDSGQPAPAAAPAAVQERPQPALGSQGDEGPTAGAAVPQRDRPGRNDQAQVGGSAATNTTPEKASEEDRGTDPWQTTTAAPAAPAGEPVAEGGDEGAADGMFDVSQAWVLDRTNWERADGLLPAQAMQRIQSGEAWYTVQPVARDALERNYSDVFWSASRANAGRYAVDPQRCALRDSASGQTPSFYFGLPFPDVAAKAPTAGCEIMWNVEAAKSIGGGEEASLTFDDFDLTHYRYGEGGPHRRLELTWRAMAFLGRQSGPIDNPDQLRSTMLLRVRTPHDVASTMLLNTRSNDPDEPDKAWSYVPALRRVRAMSPANKSDGFLGSALAPDAMNCFDAKLEMFDWRIVRRQTMLAPMASIAPIVQTQVSASRATVAVPATRAVFEGGQSSGAPWLVSEHLQLVPRPVWVVEGIAREQYRLFPTVILYVDAQLFRAYWLVGYQQDGTLLTDTMCAQHWTRSADGSFATAAASTLTAVNALVPHATLARFTSQTLDQTQGPDTLAGLTDMGGNGR